MIPTHTRNTESISSKIKTEAIKVFKTFVEVIKCCSLSLSIQGNEHIILCTHTMHINVSIRTSTRKNYMVENFTIQSKRSCIHINVYLRM